MDIQMPTIDGIEACKIMRSKGIVLPIIALTANAQQSERIKCQNAGMDDYLIKPFEELEIIQTLSKYIDIFGLVFVKQPEPLGTGHAIKCCLDEYEPDDKVLILNGDTPLIISSILQKFIQKSCSSCNVLTARFENPFGYGRIIYDKDGDFTGIVEEKDCSESQKKINIINGGIYYIHGFILKQFIPFISNNNIQKEFYLTDIVKTVKDKSWNVISTVLLDESETHYISGVNTPEELEILL
jgi:bifunctional UDP-N-acetylglucosamine pyrophosphorylase/glucosamine-1-phosphate N-acetyltransferase